MSVPREKTFDRRRDENSSNTNCRDENGSEYLCVSEPCLETRGTRRRNATCRSLRGGDRGRVQGDVTRRKSAASRNLGAISGIQASQSRFVHCLLIFPSLERELKSKTSRKEVLSIVVTSIRRGGPRFWAGRRQNQVYNVADSQTQLNSWESRWPQNNGRCNHCPCLDKHGLDQRALIVCQVVITTTARDFLERRHGSRQGMESPLCGYDAQACSLPFCKCTRSRLP